MKPSVATAFSLILLAFTTVLPGCSGSGGSNNPPPQPLVISIVRPPAGAVGTSYSAFTFNATGGVPPLTWSETGALPDGMAFSDSGTLSGTPSTPGAFPISVMAQDSTGQKATPLNCSIQISSVAMTLQMETPRAGHSATPLTTENVLVAGGVDNNQTVLATAELFDPSSSTFTFTGTMVTARTAHTANALTSGTVLVAGGTGSNNESLASAELYDLSGGAFTPTGNMNIARSAHTATLLQSGKVLVTGGQDSAGNSLASAEIFDPANGSFTAVSSMNIARAQHTATLLQGGAVLVTGGHDSSRNALISAELFDPSTNTFALTDSMETARFGHTATLLNDHTVLVAGGIDASGNASPTTERFDPATATFAATGNMTDARFGHTATLLGDGSVRVAGGAALVLSGCGDNCEGLVPSAFSSTEQFDPSSGTFSPAAAMQTNRFNHTATLLTGGKVLVTGGVHTRVTGRGILDNVLATAEFLQ